MTTYTIDGPDYTGQIVEAIRQVQDGDTDRVQSEAQAELTRRALARMRPGLQVAVEVGADDDQS